MSGIGNTSPLTEKLDVVENIHASGTIKSGTAITIDGTNDKITASSGTINFEDENLLTTGNVTATSFLGDGSNLTGVTGTDNTKVAKAGDTMTGPLTFSGLRGLRGGEWLDSDLK